MSKIRPYLMVLILWSVVAGQGMAQVLVQSASFNGELLAPTTVYQLMVNNLGGSTTIHVEGSITTRSGEPVLAFRSADHLLRAGVSSLSAASIPMRTFTYGTGPMGRTAQVHQRLAGGNYRWCVRVAAPSTEQSDEWCDELVVEDFLQLDLVMPWNGDTIDDVRPSLTWMMTGSPVATAAAEVRLTVVPVHGDAPAAQAMAAQVPFFHVPRAQHPTVFYPPGVRDLERGQCYAWQAERVVDRRVVDRSEPWKFCVKDRRAPAPLKYVRLDDLQPGTVYPVTDGRIYFRYDEPYAATTMTCAILTAERQRVLPTAVNESGSQAEEGAKTVGANLFELDLEPYGLKPGSYELMVTDGKGVVRAMRFRIER